jgi:hypothetical protein
MLFHLYYFHYPHNNLNQQRGPFLLFEFDIHYKEHQINSKKKR